jgi:Ca2+-binding RTX toxin-like protein
VIRPRGMRFFLPTFKSRLKWVGFRANSDEQRTESMKRRKKRLSYDLLENRNLLTTAFLDAETGFLFIRPTTTPQPGNFQSHVEVVVDRTAEEVVVQEFTANPTGPNEFRFPFENVTEIRYVGTSFNDWFSNRTGFRAQILGINGNDFLTGGNNADVIYGGEGADFISGWRGDDILIGNAGDDTIIEHGFFNAGNDYIRGSNGNDQIIGGNGNDRILGDDGDDTIGFATIDVPNSMKPIFEIDTLFFEAGNDVVFGGEGDDTVLTGLGSDQIFAGGGDDDVTGGLPPELAGMSSPDDDPVDDGNDLIMGGDGNDTLNGGTNNDIVIGGFGNDILTGGTGFDRLLGQEGMDQIFGGLGDDFIRGGDGDDELEGNEGNDNVWGDLGNDVIFGHTGNDRVYGASRGRDGASGIDIVDAGLGGDFVQFDALDTVTPINDVDDIYVQL